MPGTCTPPVNHSNLRNTSWDWNGSKRDYVSMEFPHYSSETKFVLNSMSLDHSSSLLREVLHRFRRLKHGINFGTTVGITI